MDNEIKIVYNNIVGNVNLAEGWGFSAYIEFNNKNILFDTGGDGYKFLKNIEKMDIKMDEIDFVFLSHNHWDHTGGFEDIVDKFKNTKMYIPKDFNYREYADKNIDFDIIEKFNKLNDKIYTTGQMGKDIIEQSLILDSEKGLIVIAGCAHPGIENITKKVKNNLNNKIFLVVGGFHLKGSSKNEINRVVDILKKLKVKKVAPSHCTGKEAIKVFKNKWKDNFYKLYLGSNFEF